MNDAPHPVFPWLTAPRRAWLYRVVVAVAPLAVLYGVLDDQAAALWLGVAATVLGTGTAALHTPTGTS